MPPLMQRAMKLIYPDQCILCTSLVDGPEKLCGTCWAEMPFKRGHSCDLCGADLLGESDGSLDHCDQCMVNPPPWSHGRAALSYKESGRRFVLILKHGDRTDLIPPACRWLAESGREFLSKETVLTPVPLHWSRMLRRRYNQAAELAKGIARHHTATCVPDALIRARKTEPQDGKGVDERFQNVAGAIVANKKRANLLYGRDVCIVDDVMTSGATLSASAQACHDMGARQICILVLARVEHTP